MGVYKIASVSSGGSCFLHVSTAAISPLGPGSNVDIIYNQNNIPGILWYIGSLDGEVQIQSTANMRYRLSVDKSTWNCGVQRKDYAANVKFKLVSGNTYRIQLVSNPNMYLTVERDGNVVWAGFDSSSAEQKWVMQEISCEYVCANDWLRMRMTPSTTGGRTVAIPRDIPSYTEITDGVTQHYAFTDVTYWYSCEDIYKNEGKINPYAIDVIRDVTGKAPVIISHPCGAYTDESSRYWIAVGPKVVYPAQKDNDDPKPYNMYAKGFLDVVIKDEFGTKFYIPAVVGDIKAHTWSNGIIQTYKAYPNGDYEPMDHEKGVTETNFNGQVCAEFIGAYQDGKQYFDMANLYSFSIDCIVFYEGK